MAQTRHVAVYRDEWQTLRNLVRFAASQDEEHSDVTIETVASHLEAMDVESLVAAVQNEIESGKLRLTITAM